MSPDSESVQQMRAREVMGSAENSAVPDGACEQCGAPGVGSTAGCLKLYEDVLAREYSDQRYFRVHQLTVDAYCLQHPEQYMISGKSFAVHLIRMYTALETNNDPGLEEALLKWIGTNPTIEKPAMLPEKRGDLTITYIHSARGPDEHVDRALEWARDAWNAWRDHHALVRRFIGVATSHPTAGPGA